MDGIPEYKGILSEVEREVARREALEAEQTLAHTIGTLMAKDSMFPERAESDMQQDNEVRIHSFHPCKP